MKIKCDVCGKKFVVGNRPDGTPNGLGLVMQNGKRVIDKIMWG